ncbi:tyrosine phosphatase protein [Parachaetomium inaequale]|uniref:Tyrosine phosphatase protein n=1 Tax=Parachaetomium inaequale TaxID=2588326 RepID=A0AAN6SN14_9PEZI|nr:tyrosine phosphatase protein [Parachaetomium inaequale]
MGQSISAIKDAAVKQNQEAEKTANDSLTALQDLAKLQVQLFRAQVINDKDPLKIPIGKMIVEDVVIKCSVEQDGDKIAGEVKETYKQFASGEIADGIGSVLSMGLKALFGNAAGNSNQTTNFIAVGGLGYPLRVDMLLYTYSFTSDSLIKVTKNVVAISLVVSSVDMKAMDDATIGATVQYCYGGAAEDVQQKIVDKLTAIRAKIVGQGGNTPANLGSDSLDVQEAEIRGAFDEVMWSEKGLLRSDKGQ